MALQGEENFDRCSTNNEVEKRGAKFQERQLVGNETEDIG